MCFPLLDLLSASINCQDTNRNNQITLVFEERDDYLKLKTSTLPSIQSPC